MTLSTTDLRFGNRAPGFLTPGFDLNLLTEEGLKRTYQTWTEL